MTFALIVVLASFVWLLWETRWLSVRLLSGKLEDIPIDISQLVGLMVTVIIGVYLVSTIIKEQEALVDTDKGI